MLVRINLLNYINKCSVNVDLSKYDKTKYNPGRGFVVRLLWYYVNLLFFKSYWLPVYGVKRLLLRMFGARVGKGVVIKPGVNIKYPWRLQVGDNVWIGEGVWIDNLADVVIGNNVVISQGAMLLTGNHDYKSRTFDIFVRPIVLEDGVWIGAKGVVTPGVTCHTHSVLTAGAVLTGDMQAYGIYQGNPAIWVKQRKIG